jgi:hypothetical protein
LHRMIILLVGSMLVAVRRYVFPTKIGTYR